MRINAVKNSRYSFQRAFTKEEMDEYKEFVPQALSKTGEHDKFIFIVHDTCLPQDSAKDIGVGNASSKTAQDFFQYMKDYTHINWVEFLPQGESHIGHNNFCCPYASTALSLGNHVINPELLTQQKFGNLITDNEFNELVASNNAPDKETIANVENAVEDNSPLDKTLRKAFNRFKESNTPEVQELKQELKTFKNKNSDWLEPKSFYKSLTKEHGSNYWPNWHNDLDKNLYTQKYSKKEVNARKKELKLKYNDDIEFYNFKQFLAEKHLALGKSELNKKGLKTIGDCQINYSHDEIWANQEAFYADGYIGNADWGIHALKYPEVSKENSAASKLFKRKINLFANRYDSIRFDVGWSYVKPKITFKNGEIRKPELGDSVLKIIENEVQKVKGKDFPLKDLIYEFESDPQDFSIFVHDNIRDSVKNRTKVFNSAYLHSSWGSNENFTKSRGLNPNYFVLGDNHDPLPMRQLAENKPDMYLDGNKIGKIYRKSEQINPLSKILKISREILGNPTEFMKAKFAENMTSKNVMLFYMNALGREERFDSQSLNKRENFRYRIPENFQKAYHDSIQEGFGFNLMDALEKIYKKDGLDKSESTLFEKIVKFKNILNEPEIVNSKNEVKGNSKFSKTAIAITSAVSIVGVGTFAYLSKIKKEHKNQ